jgi:hypothetical protein
MLGRSPLSRVGWEENTFRLSEPARPRASAPRKVRGRLVRRPTIAAA